MKRVLASEKPQGIKSKKLYLPESKIGNNLLASCRTRPEEKQVGISSLTDAWVELLSRYRWCWFGTLTFRGYPPLRKAHRLFHAWITELRDEDGAKDFHWFRVTERGAYGDNIHFHVLVGGLRNGSKYPWMVRWNELAGDALLTYHHRSGGAAKYIVKTVRPDRDFECDFDLSRADRKQKSSGPNKKANRNAREET